MDVVGEGPRTHDRCGAVRPARVSDRFLALGAVEKTASGSLRGCVDSDMVPRARFAHLRAS